MRWMLIAFLAACGGTATNPNDGGNVPTPPENVDGCWNYTLGSAAGTMHIDGSVGDFAQSGQPPSGAIYRADEPDVFVLQLYCRTIDCGIALADGGTEPKDTAPDSGDPDTRLLFTVIGTNHAHATVDGGPFSMARCP